MNHAVNYIVEGSGPPVVLLHGLAASLYDWTQLVPALAEAGYRAYAVDLLGHGDSAKPEGAEHYHVEHLYANFVEWLEEQGLEEPPYLVGHSLGGYISLWYALRHPDKVHGFVLLDPFYSRKQLSPLLRLLQTQPRLGERAIRYVPESVLTSFVGLLPTSLGPFAKTMRRQIALDYKRASPHIFHIPGSLDDLTPRLSEVQPPALVLWGERDLTLNPASFEHMLSVMPNARGHAITACYHQPHIDGPEEVNRLIIEFLNEMRDEAH